MREILISIFPDWISNLTTACLAFFFLLLWHHGRQVLRDLIEVFATAETFYFVIFIAFILFGIRKDIPKFIKYAEGRIISWTSTKSIVHFVLTIIFEYAVDIILKYTTKGKKLSVAANLIIMCILIAALFVSYKIPIHEQEKAAREARELAEEKIRLQGEAMLAENMPRAQKGDPQAQCNLGFYFQEYAHDKGQALYWYTKAAENNFARAQYILGCNYSGKFGAYSPKIGMALAATDYAKAIYWHNRASENGDSDSDYELYRMYSEGIGVTRNYSTAYMHLFTVKLAENKKGKRFYHQRELDNISKYLTRSQIKAEQNKARIRFNRMKK